MTTMIEELSIEAIEKAAGGEGAYSGWTKEEKGREQIRLDLINYQQHSVKRKNAVKYVMYTGQKYMTEAEVDALSKEIWSTVSISR